MKKLLLLISVVFISYFSYSQEHISINGTAKFSCSQKNGINTRYGDYVLNVIIEKEVIKFNTSETQSYQLYSISKKTDKYIIGEDGGDYCFYDVLEKRLYNIDYFMSRYITSGYGSGNSEIKEVTLNMMDLLKKGKTQKDVIRHLITQVEYDF